MKRRFVMLGLALAVAVGARGDVKDALASVRAPSGEYVRMPAKFVLKKIETTARRSGEPGLSVFSVEVRFPGLEDRRIDINLESKNLLEALEGVAAETGAKLLFEGASVVLIDPGTVAAANPEPVEAPPVERRRSDDSEVAFQDVDNALVFVSAGDHAGSGFVAEMNGKTYVFSNQHNFLGATKLELRAMHGGLLEFDSFEFSRSRDLVRFRLKEASAKDLDVLRFSSVSPTHDQEVVVYGNSAGGNVATELRGKVLGVGPSDIEVDAKIVPGNSGSPILNTQGEVIGVATYLTFDLKFDKDDARSGAFKGSRFKKTRRYGVRVPTDGWVPVDMRKFLEQTYVLEDSKNQLRIMQVLTEYWRGDDEYAAEAKKIMDSYGGGDRRVKPVFTFHSGKREEEARLMVKAFKRNHEEFADIVADMGLGTKTLNKFKKELEKGKASHKIQRVDHHIRNSMLMRVKLFHDDLERRVWMSAFLSQCARPLESVSGQLIQVLESEGDISDRIKAVM